MNEGIESVTRNLADVEDDFICEKCGMEVVDIENREDEEEGEERYYLRAFEYCPYCGRKVIG